MNELILLATRVKLIIKKADKESIVDCYNYVSRILLEYVQESS